LLTLHLIRTVVYLIPLIAVYTIVLGTCSLASSLFGGSGRFAHGCARLWSWLILATTGVDVELRGLDRVARNRSYLFISNHQSIYDIPVLFWHLPFQLRILAKESLGQFPFLGWHLARTGHVLVQRQNPGATVFKKVSALMHAGHSLIVFPEGTRSADGRLAKFKGGIFLLAIEAGLPIVPVAIDRTRFVMRKGRLTTCPGFVTLQVMDPIETAGLTKEDARVLAQQVRDRIAAALPAMAGPPAGQAPAEPAPVELPPVEQPPVETPLSEQAPAQPAAAARRSSEQTSGGAG
jgi:1-acyl-sn-glycerol-3-phosphate acyltransferase